MRAQLEVDGYKISPETVAWAAQRTVEMHETGRCAKCPGEGDCKELAMAHSVLLAFEEVGR